MCAECLFTETVLTLQGQQGANEVTVDRVKSRRVVVLYVVMCVWSGQSEFWALLMVVVNLWIVPGFQFEFSS